MKRLNTHDPKKAHRAWRDAIDLAWRDYGTSKNFRGSDRCLALRHFLSLVYFYTRAETHAKYTELSNADANEMQRLLKSMNALEEDLLIKIGCT